MSSKPGLAFCWLASCGGCEESFVDLAEGLLDLLDALDLVYCPALTDTKRSDLENLPDRSLLASLVNGCVRTSEDEAMARLLRRKSRFIVAYGACAQYGGVPALGNLLSREQILQCVYAQSISTVNEAGSRPASHCESDGASLALPEFLSLTKALNQVVDVDLYLPGCPPTPDLLASAVNQLLSGTAPSTGTVLAPDVPLCDECPRRAGVPESPCFRTFVRPHLAQTPADACFLAHSVICMGPATRGGCGAQCVRGNMPCTGCFGPTSRVRDQGAKMIAAVASLVEGSASEEIDATLATIPDLVGTLYRYGLSGSLTRARIDDGRAEVGVSHARAPQTR
jgi:F420-non-reducing hydrogenase small subunit